MQVHRAEWLVVFWEILVCLFSVSAVFQNEAAAMWVLRWTVPMLSVANMPGAVSMRAQMVVLGVSILLLGPTALRSYPFKKAMWTGFMGCLSGLIVLAHRRSVEVRGREIKALRLGELGSSGCDHRSEVFAPETRHSRGTCLPRVVLEHLLRCIKPPKGHRSREF